MFFDASIEFQHRRAAGRDQGADPEYRQRSASDFRDAASAPTTASSAIGPTSIRPRIKPPCSCPQRQQRQQPE